MPVLNEELYLADAVTAVLSQDYEGEQELILALGPSTDGTAQIAEELASRDSRIRLVDNPARDIPVGLNLAVAESSHEIIVRVDAHSQLSADYTRVAVNSLLTHNADNVGGIMQAAGHSEVQQAIARAYNSPFGLGGGTYHGEGTSGVAESAYLGVFRRAALERVGGFDPTVRRGEDWELNLRIRRSGGIIWFEPQLRVTYWPRVSFRQLAQQFFATGAWRALLVRRYPAENPWRFYAPGLLVLGLAFSAGIGVLQVFGVIPSHIWTWIPHAIPLSYVLGIAGAAVLMPGRHGFRGFILSTCALVTMHVTWGAGFLVGLLSGASNTVDRSRMTLGNRTKS